MHSSKLIDLYRKESKFYDINYTLINLTLKILPLIVQLVSTLLWAEVVVSLDSVVILCSSTEVSNLGKVPHLQLWCLA